MATPVLLEPWRLRMGHVSQTEDIERDREAGKQKIDDENKERETKQSDSSKSQQDKGKSST